MASHKRQKISVETAMDADYADDLALPGNAADQSESLLHSRGKWARGIRLYENFDKTEFMHL